MEERKTVFDYMGQVFMTFGFSILALNLFCVLVGEEAQEISTLYELGSKGLTVQTTMQFFGLSVCMTGLRYLFFSDRVIKRMSITLRAASMLLCIVGVVTVGTILFDWFPYDMWQAWAGFFITFAICFTGSVFVVKLKERTENRQMEKALQRLKEQDRKNRIGRTG